MDKVASANINTFGQGVHPRHVPPVDEPVLEIPLSELQSLLNELLLTHNQMAEMVGDAGILRGRNLARLTEDHARALKAEKSPITKILLLNAYIRQLLNKIRDGLKKLPAEGRKVVQVCSKVMARAIQLVDYIKAKVQDDPKRREVALDSQQARILFQGAGDGPVSRKETIRAMKRAERLWPALMCGHKPHDGRQTMRLTATVEELQDQPILAYRDIWQRSGKALSLSL